MKKLWYLSFADKRGFLGACVVQGKDIGEAIYKSHQLKINPGGMVFGIPFDPAKINLPLNQLMSRAELETFGPVIRKGDSKIQEIGKN